MNFVGGAWQADTKAGTFRRFLEAYAGLDRETFLAKLPWPHILIGAELDPTIWDKGLVLRVAPRNDGSLVVVGRQQGEVDIVLNCPTVSNKHVALEARDGAWTIADLGSRAGTFVDGTKLEQGEKRSLPSEPCLIDLGPDVRGEFFLPEALHAFLTEAHKSRPGTKRVKRVPPLESSIRREPWPTWSLLQPSSSKTDTSDNLPAYVRPPGSGQYPLPKLAPPVGAEPAPLERVSWWGIQKEVLFGTRQKVIRTLVVAVVILALGYFVAPQVFFLMFWESHPEWFETKEDSGH